VVAGQKGLGLEMPMAELDTQDQILFFRPLQQMAVAVAELKVMALNLL
jgi:hypothetical protein